MVAEGPVLQCETLLESLKQIYSLENILTKRRTLLQTPFQKLGYKTQPSGGGHLQFGLVPEMKMGQQEPIVAVVFGVW